MKTVTLNVNFTFSVPDGTPEQLLYLEVPTEPIEVCSVDDGEPIEAELITFETVDVQED